MGSLLSWKSFDTNLITREDLPTAASPKRTNLIEVVAELISRMQKVFDQRVVWCELYSKRSRVMCQGYESGDKVVMPGRRYDLK